MMPSYQLSEAPERIQHAGLDIPSDDELKLRHGMDYPRVYQREPMRP
ncbi:MAG: hypothetical protein AAFX86_14150 [Pseudomonadota bacterium]